MDTNSMVLLLDLICEGIGVASKHVELARRVRMGDIITDEEIKEARLEVAEAVNQWEEAGKDQ